jgi:hypothetical protein
MSYSNIYYKKYLKYKSKYMSLESSNVNNKAMVGGALLDGGVLLDSGPRLMELAVDIGNTNIKIAVRQFDRNHFTVHSYPIMSGEMKGVFGDPDEMPRRLIEFTNKILPNGSVIFKISFSTSGIVKTGENEVTVSYALNRMSKPKKYDGYNITDKFRGLDIAHKIKPVFVLNDACAAGVGTIVLKQKQGSMSKIRFPLLSLTMGSGPTICVVDREEFRYVVYTNDGAWGAKITRDDGKEVVLYEAIGKHQWDRMVRDVRGSTSASETGDIPQEAIERYSKYVRLSLLSLLRKYQDKFGARPKTILLSGGLANVVNEEKLSNILDSRESPNIITLKGDSQKDLLHFGSSAYGDIGSFIDISWTL